MSSSELTRRGFLQNIAGAVTAGALAGARPAAAAGFPADAPWRRLPRTWTWVHGGGERTAAEWRRRFDELRAGGIDGVLVSGGDKAMLSDAARAAGLDFHRWIWTLNRSGDAAVKEQHPEWFTISRNGESSLEKPPYVGYYQWLCPTREPVREYLRGIVDELARDPDLDGVHLDYVRHCDVILPIGLWPKYDLVQDREYAEFDFCYCDVCRETFAAQTGRDPMELGDDAPADVEWRAFRWDSVTGLVRGLADAVHARGRPITAAVFPTPTIARTLVRQAWEQWPLDAVFPMLYNGFYNEGLDWIGRSVAEGVSALPADRPLYAGLYLPELTAEQLARAVRIARDAGAAGVSTFEMNGLSPDHLRALTAIG